jgi:hypothetical protein
MVRHKNSASFFSYAPIDKKLLHLLGAVEDQGAMLACSKSSPLTDKLNRL